MCTRTEKKTGRMSKTNLLLGDRLVGGFSWVPSFVLPIVPKFSTLGVFISVTTVLKRHQLNRQAPVFPVTFRRAGSQKLPEQTASIAQGVVLSFPVSPKQAQTGHRQPQLRFRGNLGAAAWVQGTPGSLGFLREEGPDARPQPPSWLP